MQRLEFMSEENDDKLRDEIVPINKKYPIEKLLNACQDYLGKENKRKHVTIEYILINALY